MHLSLEQIIIISTSVSPDVIVCSPYRVSKRTPFSSTACEWMTRRNRIKGLRLRLSFAISNFKRRTSITKGSTVTRRIHWMISNLQFNSWMLRWLLISDVIKSFSKLKIKLSNYTGSKNNLQLNVANRRAIIEKWKPKLVSSALFFNWENRKLTIGLSAEGV